MVRCGNLSTSQLDNSISDAYYSYCRYIELLYVYANYVVVPPRAPR